ncbi:Hypp7712 [Branchiostoma lanceolatum]|uniref:Hypp7712 protein n=1 Tax=Branchiostoma lanceolatum TaxID=7740 RepID=A0A8J9Z387_BRALA|nr:Hypp7712 [Branchiostoma lanceolatum]
MNVATNNMQFAGCCPTCDEFACGVDELHCGFCGFRMQFSSQRAGYSRHVNIPAPRPPVFMVGNPWAASNVNDIVQDLLAMIDRTDQVYVVVLAVRESALERDTLAVASVQAEDSEDSDSDFEDIWEEIPEDPPPPRPVPETCFICADRQQDCLLSPCGHSICTVCGFEVRERGNMCPWCKGNIEDIVPMET